jgi:hypothetical protein
MDGDDTKYAIVCGTEEVEGSDSGTGIRACFKDNSVEIG